MFDSTGILELFCSRIHSQERHPQNSSSPHQCREDDGYSTPSRQDLFVVSVFLMERFDWMGQDVATMSFSLNDGPAQHIEYVNRPDFSDMPPRLRDEDEMKYYDGCFEGQRRVDMRSAELRPGIYITYIMRVDTDDSKVNGEGWPLPMHERDVSNIKISMQRGRKEVKVHGDVDRQQTYFVPASGAAGFVTNIIFAYESTYRGIVHMISTLTYTRTEVPRLELTRELQYGARKRPRESYEGSHDHDGDTIEGTRPTKAARLTDSDALETDFDGRAA
ncbi:hypothetical protein Slin15195_G027310 [Septoria linicola]|uniref:Uncharacterized protein n=1 Tax=Septoria linicola TaxID=215465 RepID=A0A9Q9EH11_9PEZI|nr:hypothetical protein Slin15195_G027310 [Septoria linicola]